MPRPNLFHIPIWTAVVLIGTAIAAPPPARTTGPLPGQQADGSMLLPNQWSLRPAGKHLNLGDFPVNIAVHPAGEFAAVLHSGYGDHEIIIVDLEDFRIVSRTPLAEAFYGLTFSPDGAQLYCSGAGDEVIHAFAFRQGLLAEPRELRLRPLNQRGVPGGLAVSRDGRSLWTANVWGHRVTGLDTATGQVQFDLALAPGRDTASPPVVPPTDPDLAAATKRDEAKLDPAKANDPYPYAVALDEPRQRLYVSLWAQSRVAVIDLRQPAVATLWSVQEHPNELLLGPSGRALFVANANRNTVTVLDPETGRTIETLSSLMSPDAPPGSTPNSLALSPDGSLLFVANACNNNVAVFDVATPGQSRSLGLIPVGWYPTSVRVTPDGRHLLVANGKGMISRSNRHGPQPGPRDTPGTVREYIAGLFRGSLSLIDLPPQREKLLERLKVWTEQAQRCSPPATRPVLASKPGWRHPIPASPGDPSPIKYCLYIVKENRTYDQVLGDLPQGNGDPSLCLFPEAITPNHHQLAREFVLLDNFYVESEVSADGHEWSLGAYATDFVEKAWPMSYGHNTRGKYSYPSEGAFRIAWPASGYLWDRAREAGVSYRSYGEFISNGATVNDPAHTTIPALVDHFDPGFRGWDLEYPDVKRADRFISELRRFEREGSMPRLQILRLPNDHTYGTSVGKRSPRALMADNDLAFGRVVEAISQSKFWRQTAIFVVEDDAQNGPDHVDAHRTIAYAISPYVRRGTVDSTMYSTCSMLRTMELILGLRPLTQFDAAAAPMDRSFQARPDFRPYRHREVNVDREEKNLASAFGAEASARMDFAQEDAADDVRLNQVIWGAMRGPDLPMPAPVRAAFVRAAMAEDE